jgi:hypothetical protein
MIELAVPIRMTGIICDGQTVVNMAGARFRSRKMCT